MLAYVVYVHITYAKSFADVALGYGAGLLVAGCALVVHWFYKKEKAVEV
jgi:hypothetical protein